MALLSAFNPHDFSEATVRTVATGRDDTLDGMLATIRSNLDAATMQHLIVSAPRGYGKSFLMRHIQFDIERAARDEGLPLAVVLMPEELPHVKEPETLVRELTRALTGGKASEAELTWHEDDGAAWDGATEELQAAIRDKVGSGGLVVALIENFDVLLRRAFPKEMQASRLRTLLTDRDGRLMVVAASATGAFDRDYDGRLFHAFREVALEPWSVDECMAFFDRQRAEAGRAPLDDAARARGRAVASFIGGTPRLATLLGDALFDDDVLHAADLLQKLVDDLTPYYKERIEALPGRSQKLLDALLRGGEPATPSEVARRVQARSQAAIAGPFSDLVRERIVVGEKAPGSAEMLYRVADRVFAHFYRGRVLNHGTPACPLEALVDLLAQFFTPEEQRNKAAEFARLGRIAEARVMARLDMGERGRKAGHPSDLHHLAERYIPRRLRPLASPAIVDDLDAIAAEARRGNVDRAYAIIATQLPSMTFDDRAILLLARSVLDRYEGIDGGVSAAEEVFTLSKSLADPVLRLEARVTWIWHLQDVNQEDAIALADEVKREATRLGRTDYDSRVMRYIAFSLGRLGRHEEAVTTAMHAADLARIAEDSQYEATALRLAAFSLGELGRHEEAVTTARRAANMARADGDKGEEAVSLRYVADSLEDLGRYEEAVATARQAADLAGTAGDKGEEAMSLRLAAFSLGKLGLYEQAVATALQATELARTAGDKGGEAVSLRYAAANLGELGRHEDAVATARQAFDLARTAGDKGEEAAALSSAAFDLGQLGRHEDAVATARQAADLAKAAGDAGGRAEALALASWYLGDLGDHPAAIAALSAAALIVDDHPTDRLKGILAHYAGRLAPQAAASLVADLDLNALHVLLHAAADHFDHAGQRQTCLAEWVEGFAAAATLRLQDAATLEAWATAIALRFPARFAEEVAHLRHAARYHGSHRSRDALARVDPDLARTLQTLFPPADDPPATTKKASSRRRR